MAFSLEISECQTFHDFKDEGDTVVITRIGSDPWFRKTYFAVVALTPYMEDCPEYWFSIIERDPDTDSERWLMSGLKVADLFSREDKDAILWVICQATARLLHLQRPRQVYRCTQDTNPPDKALEKHYLISGVFAECGYKLARTDVWHGQRVWIAERVDDLVEPHAR